MKITRYLSVFMLIAVILLFQNQVKIDRFQDVSNKKIEYNSILDAAIDAALESTVQSADGLTVEIDKELCVENFYKALYAGFDAIDSETAQQKLQYYTPVLAIADVDGLFVNYSDEVSGSIKKYWSQKIPYSAYYSGIDASGTAFTYVVNYCMGDSLTVTIIGDQNVYSGEYEELSEVYKDNYAAEYRKIRAVMNGEVLGAKGYFELHRESAIQSVIVDQLNYYVNRHNDIAEAFGEQFTFQLPTSAVSSVARAIENVSFISFFQGYPYGMGLSEVYSNFEVSGARIAKNKGYFVREVGGFLYYHREGCYAVYSSDVNDWYSSAKECALVGALPCPYCEP